MATTQFTPTSFLIRWVIATILVGLTYNPSGYSLFHWYSDVLPSYSAITPAMIVSGLILLIGWVIYLRATMRSLGIVGTALAAALIAALIWWAFDLGWLDRDDQSILSWIGVIFVSLVLGVGLSWSHIRRRLTGQLDVDDHDDD